METRIAACSCGRLRLNCAGEPASVSLCHCRECQRRTGSSYGIAAFYEREKVSISGEFRDYVRQSDSGYKVTQHFCPHCGGTVFWEPERKPQMLAVAVGAFADPGFPAPAKQVYTEHRPAWLTLPDLI
ncbi:GFA family protein [Bosea sp. (in: a-proteobacteria)]|uniref:GFA family protein n=1 Tax=Bosea sp. (in: a-proteobacteria) TaxID=1871050 RepID=UPI002FC5D8D9